MFTKYFLHTKGQVTTIAGNGAIGFADGPGQTAIFNNPRSICYSQFHGCLFVCDRNHRIRKIDLTSGLLFLHYDTLLNFLTCKHRKCKINWDRKSRIQRWNC